MKTFLTIILAMSFCFAEEPAPKPLPKDVQTIVDAREKALSEARIAFDKAVFKANDDAVKKMESVVKTSTQKGDLDGALASKKFVEDWNKEKDAVAVSGALGGAGPKGDDLSKMIVGKWNGSVENWIFTITFDEKTATTNDGVKGIYTIQGNKITIKWQNNIISELNIKNNSGSIKCSDRKLVGKISKEE